MIGNRGNVDSPWSGKKEINLVGNCLIHPRKRFHNSTHCPGNILARR